MQSNVAPTYVIGGQKASYFMVFNTQYAYSRNFQTGGLYKSLHCAKRQQFTSAVHSSQQPQHVQDLRAENLVDARKPSNLQIT